MTIAKVTEIFREVMYLDNEEIISPDKSLFLDYDMTSIDFIDFSFEVKKSFKLSAEPDDIWPVNKMAMLANLYSPEERKWSDEGIRQLTEVLTCDGRTPCITAHTDIRSLYAFFTLRYISKKIHELH